MDEHELLGLLIRGEAPAWAHLVGTTAPLLHGVVARLLGRRASETEDVVQTVFLRLWEDDRRRLRTFQGRCRLATWLVAVARREALERLRGRVVLPTTEASPDGRTNGAASEVESSEERVALRAAMDRLPARDRLLVQLVHLDGCPYREAAVLLSVPENSISPWLLRARQRLRVLLEPETEPTPRTGTSPQSLQG